MVGPNLSPEARAAVSAFLAINVHMEDCYRCRKANTAIHDAGPGRTLEVVREQKGNFCPAGVVLFDDLARTSMVAFGEPGDV